MRRWGATIRAWADFARSTSPSSWPSWRTSSVYFAALASAFVPVRYFEYRPVDLHLTGLTCGRADLLRLPLLSRSVDSLSCMHVVEHVLMKIHRIVAARLVGGKEVKEIVLNRLGLVIAHQGRDLQILVKHLGVGRIAWERGLQGRVILAELHRVFTDLQPSREERLIGVGR